MADPPPQHFIPRPAEFDALIQRLMADGINNVAITAALRGAGGYGKTTLAKAICHDERIQQAFDDGVLWITLGEKVENPIQHINDLILILSGKKFDSATLDGAITKLRELLEARDILMVIDDVWHRSDLKPFLEGGSRCARLITTRNDDVLPPQVLKIKVEAMQTNEARQLLGAGLPDGQDAD